MLKACFHSNKFLFINLIFSDNQKPIHPYRRRKGYSFLSYLLVMILLLCFFLFENIFFLKKSHFFITLNALLSAHLCTLLLDFRLSLAVILVLVPDQTLRNFFNCPVAQFPLSSAFGDPDSIAQGDMITLRPTTPLSFVSLTSV